MNMASGFGRCYQSFTCLTSDDLREFEAAGMRITCNLGVVLKCCGSEEVKHEGEDLVLPAEQRSRSLVLSRALGGD